MKYFKAGITGITADNLNKAGFSALFPHEQVTPDLTVKVEEGVLLLKGQVVKYAGGNSPSFTAPTTNPRIDLLVMDSAGVLSRVAGTEAASPVAPAYPSDKFTICEVFNRVEQTSIKSEDDTVQGYVSKDSRAFGGAVDAIDISFVADGALALGDKVGVASNDKVRKILSGLNLGAEQIFKAAATAPIAVDTIGTDKIVVAYIHSAASPKVRVGTIAGDGTITWGTETEVNAGTGFNLIDVCKLDTDKFVVVFGGGNRVRYGRAATVSGTTPTFGTLIDFGDFPSAVSEVIKCCQLGVDKFAAMAGASDSALVVWANTVSGTTITKGADNAVGMGNPPDGGEFLCDLAQMDTDKFAIAYKNLTDTKGKVKVCTVSGTSITLGTETEFEAGVPSEITIYCPTTSNLVVAFTVSLVGKIRGATVSGTTPTFGTVQTYNNADSARPAITNIITGLKKCGLVFRDVGATNEGHFIHFKIDGSTINGISAESTFNAADTDYVAVVGVDNLIGYFVIAYRDNGNTNQGTAIVNKNIMGIFLGITQAAVGDGANVLVRVEGVDANQSGLTAGRKYWIDAGGLTTTDFGDDLSVGIAKNATSIVLK